MALVFKPSFETVQVLHFGSIGGFHSGAAFELQGLGQIGVPGFPETDKCGFWAFHLKECCNREGDSHAKRPDKLGSA